MIVAQTHHTAQSAEYSEYIGMTGTNNFFSFFSNNIYVVLTDLNAIVITPKFHNGCN